MRSARAPCAGVCAGLSTIAHVSRTPAPDNRLAQPALPFESLEAAAAPEFVRNPRARRYVLRLRADGVPRVTIPRGGSRAEAERFVVRHEAWIARQREKLAAAPVRRGWRIGQAVWWRGVRTTLAAVPAPGGGSEVIVGDVRVHLAASLVALPHDLRPALSRRMRAIAAAELPVRLRELAARDGLEVSRVVIRDQRTRWGSCAHGGAISLNWRLMQMPDGVRDYVLWHELMHIRVANHSRRFWAQVLRVCPDYLGARAWLRREGRSL